jgi:hypothetical protein
MGMDLVTSMLGCTGKVECIGGAEKSLVGGFPEKAFDALLDWICEWKPAINAIL